MNQCFSYLRKLPPPPAGIHTSLSRSLVCFSGIVSFLAIACIQISSVRKSPYHTFSSMVKQYTTQKLLALVARYMRRRFDRDTKHFMKVS